MESVPPNAWTESGRTPVLPESSNSRVSSRTVTRLDGSRMSAEESSQAMDANRALRASVGVIAVGGSPEIGRTGRRQTTSGSGHDRGADDLWTRM